MSMPFQMYFLLSICPSAKILSVYRVLLSFADTDMNSSNLSSVLFYLVLFNLIVIIIAGELGILGTVPVQRVCTGCLMTETLL